MHADRRWLDSRLEPFRAYYLPSVQRLRVPVVLLCSSQSAEYVSRQLRDLRWLSIVVQDGWYGGWQGAPDQVVTRLDSDDALHADWFRRLDTAGTDAEVICTREFLRLDARSGKVYAFRRREPSSLAAFRHGANPFAHDHKVLDRHYRTHCLAGPYLLQVVHGGNLVNRAPAWWRFHRRVPEAELAAFGVAPQHARAAGSLAREASEETAGETAGKKAEATPGATAARPSRNEDRARQGAPPEAGT